MSDADEKANTDAAENSEESGRMSFLDHLDELRKRLVSIAIYLGLGFVACFYFSADIYNFLSAPIVQEIIPVEGSLQYTNPTGAFLISMKVSLLASVFLTLPFTFFEVWKFISPGLYRKEKKYVVPFVLSSVLLFVSGAVFCYIIVLPTRSGF